MQAALCPDKIPQLLETDILVVGAGSAGCAAALAAKACSPKHRVTLIERYGYLGGTSTGILDTFYGFFTPGEQPRKVVGGIPDQVVDALDQRNAVFLRPNTYGAGTGVTYNPEVLKAVWEDLMAKAGVSVICHVLLIDVETDAQGLIRAVILATKRGLFRIAASRFIDASGDADLCHWGGVPYEKAGDLDPAQTLTTTFRMANVDLKAFGAAGGKSMLMQRMQDAADSGSHELPRKTGSFHPMAIENCVATVAVRVADVDATNFMELTVAEIEGRRQAFLFETFLRDCVPGYEKARIIGLSTQIGVRETRRVYGEYRLTLQDCLERRTFDDAVLLCGAPVEDHRMSSAGAEETVWKYIPEGGTYQVPYRTLVAKGRDELWVVGRCFSATHDAHASCRSMGQTMSMGQAAGVAAALSIEQDCGARGVNVPQLRDRLFNLGAVLEHPEQLAQTGAQDWSKNRGAVTPR